MTYTDRIRADAARDAKAVLPPGCQEGFARLIKLVRARPGKFQLLILDCRDEGLRDRLIGDLDERLKMDGRRSALVRLNPRDYPDFATLERTLTERAKTSGAIHVTGGPSWFDAAKWDSFNIRRESVAHRVRASVLLWLDEDSIADLGTIAIDLWAWRAAVITFTSAPRSVAVRAPDVRIIDDRARGERAARIAFLRQVVAEPDLPDDMRFGFLLEMGDLSDSTGQVADAETAYREAALAATDEHSRAIAMGKIADVLQARGQLDEALRIYEEELPLYDRLGDVRARAVTMGRIADILRSRGQFDDALRIHQEEQLPVYDRLGDVRERAVTMGRIADILRARGQLDEALRIHQEEELPVYDRLGDVRARAVTMGKIADILLARGQLDEALRIYQEEQLPVYDRLGDVRERAVTMGRIADILRARGQFDEALRIYQEEQLPVYGRLGDVRARAVTMGKIADILRARGQLDEALRIRQEEELPVYDRLGDVRARAVTLYKVAGILIEAGGLADERAERIHHALSEAFGIARQLDLADGVAYTGMLLAQVLAGGGLSDEALAVLDQAEGGFRRLGDTQGVTDIRALRQTIGGDARGKAKTGTGET